MNHINQNLKNTVHNTTVFMKLSFVLSFFVFMQFSTMGYAQSSTHHIVSGKVVDKTNNPLIGVNIVVKGTKQGTITNLEGEYTISVPSNAVLVYSFVSYQTKEVKVDKRIVVDVVLEDDVHALNEFVVVGYGIQKRETLTGAISTIATDKIMTTSGSSLAQKLQGKVSGLNIRQSSGQPGTFENDIRIRGFEEAPLFVIDGIVRSNSEDFQKLSAEDIESISVLKDASAAIYGMNADNGVIIVKTKRGTSGKVRFTINGNYGISTPTDIVKMADANQYAILRQEANLNVGKEADPTGTLSPWVGRKGTDWYDEVFKKYSNRSEFNISAEGGNDKMSFYVNGGALNEKSILRTDDINYNKYNLRANISANLTNHLSMTVLVSGFKDKKSEPKDGIFNIWRGMISTLPIHQPYANWNEDYINYTYDGQSYNPIATSNKDIYGYNETENTKYNTSLEVEYKAPFLDGLRFKAVLAYDGTHNQNKGLERKYNIYNYDLIKDAYIPVSSGNDRISNYYNNNNTLTLQGYAIYDKTIAKNHNIAATFVYEQRSWNERWASIGKDFVFYTNDQLNSAVVSDKTLADGLENKSRNMSYVAKIDYDYKGKYLLGLIGRYDGSYRYHPDHRWGFFPVVSVGWRISEEPFIKENLKWLDNLKIRGSYGQVGHDAGNTFQYVEAFSDNGGQYEFENGKVTPGVMSPSLVVKDLSWTKNTTYNIAIEMRLFNSLDLGFELFRKDRTGIPAQRSVTLPNTVGVDFPDENINSRRTQGMEFYFAYNNKFRDVRYNIGGNMTISRTMWKYKEHGTFASSWDRWKGLNDNRWDDVIWTYNLQGQYQNFNEISTSALVGGYKGNGKLLPGDFRYEDVNGDGVIDGNDLQPNFTNNIPKINFGLDVGLSWHNFDLYLLFQGAAMFSQKFTHAYTTMFWEEANLPAYFFNRWHMTDYNDPYSEWISGTWPAMRTNDGDLEGTMLYEDSKAWRKDCSYLRLKNLELGYTFKEKQLKRVGLTSCRLFFNMTNVFTIANSYIKPFDPERIGQSNGSGWVYPIMKSYNLGLNIQF